jgi:hypothetical protein
MLGRRVEVYCRVQTLYMVIFLLTHRNSPQCELPTTLQILAHDNETVDAQSICDLLLANLVTEQCRSGPGAMPCHAMPLYFPLQLARGIAHGALERLRVCAR